MEREIDERSVLREFAASNLADLAVRSPPASDDVPAMGPRNPWAESSIFLIWSLSFSRSVVCVLLMMEEEPAAAIFLRVRGGRKSPQFTLINRPMSESIVALFQDAADHVAGASTSKSAAFTQDKKLALYGLYKQSLVGKCNTKRPGMFDLSGRAKW